MPSSRAEDAVGLVSLWRGRDVKVTVVTNSLAATDEPLVHNGYSHYRRDMLEAGVDVYELSPTRTRQSKRLGMFGASLGRLHAKTAVIDRRVVFIGSMNLDPRSATINTELGAVIDSPQLAKELDADRPGCVVLGLALGLEQLPRNLRGLRIELDFAKRTQIDVSIPIEIVDNIVVRAARLVLDELKVKAWVRFFIDKRIPLGGGLANVLVHVLFSGIELAYPLIEDVGRVNADVLLLPELNYGIVLLIMVVTALAAVPPRLDRGRRWHRLRPGPPAPERLPAP